ncbi:MAG TPA: four helix bundle protein [Terriglobales bacterium]|nr:four helix bundle protein [Terriglobales bacterium]
MNRTYRDLVVWQKSMELVSEVYRVTGKFPRTEIYGITSQMRRAAVSIPSNLAEGQARYHPGDFLRFIGHARGSLVELETQIMISTELGYCSPDLRDQLLERTAHIGALTNNLYTAVQRRTENGERRTFSSQ